MLAMDNLEMRVSELTQEVRDMKAASPVRPEGTPVMDTSSLLEEIRKGFRAAAEGQDRLLLSILETVREAKKGGSDAHEKMEDALKYLIDKVREETKATKKRWF